MDSPSELEILNRVRIHRGRFRNLRRLELLGRQGGKPVASPCSLHESWLILLSCPCLDPAHGPHPRDPFDDGQSTLQPPAQPTPVSSASDDGTDSPLLSPQWSKQYKEGKLGIKDESHLKPEESAHH